MDIILKVLEYYLLSPVGSRANIFHLSKNILYVLANLIERSQI